MKYPADLEKCSVVRILDDLLQYEFRNKDLFEQLTEANLEQYAIEEENCDEVIYIEIEKQREMKYFVGA